MAFAYYRPASIGAARALAAKGGWILAGGQSLMPLVNRGDVDPPALIDINRIRGLDRIERKGDCLEIGALARLERVRTDPLVRAHAPLLAAALAWVANPGVRQRGTLVGNAVASPPGAEAVAALALHGASIVVAGPEGEAGMEVPLASPPAGAFAIALRVPLAPPGTRAGFFEVQRRFGHLGLVGAGVMEQPGGRMSAVLSGVIDVPLAAGAVARAISCGALDDASILAALDADLDGRIPRADIHATARYRRDVVPAVVRRAVHRLRCGVEGPVHGTPVTASAPVASPADLESSLEGNRHSAVPSTDVGAVIGSSSITVRIDDELRTLPIRASTTLAERLDLRIGCGEGVCGACTVALDGVPVRACLILAAQADGCRVDTVKSLPRLEGAVADADGLTPLQRHVRDQQAFQCGYCIPGLLVGTACFLRGREQVEGSEIATHLAGHLCRCLASTGVTEALGNLLRERRGESS